MKDKLKKFIDKNKDEIALAAIVGFFASVAGSVVYAVVHADDNLIVSEDTVETSDGSRTMTTLTKGGRTVVRTYTKE